MEVFRFDHDGGQPPVRRDGRRTTWQLHQLPAVEAEPVKCAGLGNYTIASAGEVFYRLHGLTQFGDSVSSAHGDTFVVDVQTSAQAGESDYPFTPSVKRLRATCPSRSRRPSFRTN